jgi:hypothetical protein
MTGRSALMLPLDAAVGKPERRHGDCGTPKSVTAVRSARGMPISRSSGRASLTALRAPGSAMCLRATVVVVHLRRVGSKAPAPVVERLDLRALVLVAPGRIGVYRGQLRRLQRFDLVPLLNETTQRLFLQCSSPARCVRAIALAYEPRS